jgi:hypothetical protein
MSWLIEFFRIAIYHGALTGGAMVVGGIAGLLLASGALFLLHRLWFSLLAHGPIDDPRPLAPPTHQQRLGQIAHALSWISWLVMVPIVLSWCGASIGGAFAIRGLLEDPRPVDGAVDLALWGCEKALRPLVASEGESSEGGLAPLALALSFVDGSDRFRIDTVPKRIDAFSDESVRRALEQVDGFLDSDPDSGDPSPASADPLVRWLASRVIELLDRATIDAARGRWVEPVIEQLRVEAADSADPERTDGPQVVRVLARHYGQRPFARGFFWGILLQAGAAMALLLGWIVACFAALVLLRWLSREPRPMPLR